jgi:hypothetical protein
MNWIELPHEPCHLGVPSRASKTILSPLYVWRKLCTYLALALTLSQNRPKRDSTCPCHLGLPSGAYKMISKPMVRSTQIVHLSCTDWHCLQMEWNEHPLEPRHLGVPSGASKIISDPMVCLAQTMHLSCIKVSTISKWTESSFHLSLITMGIIGCVQNDLWA